MATKARSPVRMYAQKPSAKTVQLENINNNINNINTNNNSNNSNNVESSLTSGRHPLCPVPEAAVATSRKQESSPAEPPNPEPRTPRGKKRTAPAYRQSENVDGNLGGGGSASNTPEKPREKRPMQASNARITSSLTSSSTKLTWQYHSMKNPAPSPAMGRSLQESFPNKSVDSDPGGNSATPTKNNNARQLSSSVNYTGATKTETPKNPSRIPSQGGKPPLSDSGDAGSKILNQNNPPSSSSTSTTSSTTPNRSVTRSLRYGATPSSAVSVSSSARGGGGGAGKSMVEQQLDVEENPAFWKDHNVQVILRTRPISAAESAVKGFNRCVRQDSPHTITWTGQPESRFTFDHVAGEHITQEKLFRVAGVPMVENCMAGYNSCMFCYGQTGSGKTHTMLGDLVGLEHLPSKDRGMIPRVFEYLFSKIQMDEAARSHEQLKYVCKCSFLEIFNEQITDLLEPTSTNLQMREDNRKGVYVENLSEVEVASVQDVVHLLLLGAANRKMAATNMNRESSRSHCVFTCIVESKREFDSVTNTRYGRLNLVDLAGSERQKNSGAEGERLKEAANINKSLSTLGLVIMILVDVANGKQRHVPYRDSKLTYLLQDSLGGNSKTTMIANISPSSCCALETLSTLKFAQRAKFIRNNAVVNEDASGDLNGLRQEIQELKEELNQWRRQGLSRTPSRHSGSDSVLKGGHLNSMALVPVDEEEQSRCSMESWEYNKALTGPRFYYKKLNAMEGILAGALRREQEAESSQKRLAAEIEQLTRLVKQREDDTQCSKMMLRFREDKIKRLESLSAGFLTAELYLMQEKNTLVEELQLLQAKIDRNPELTRFAMENIRLLEQLRRFQDFYTGGEREAMADEISNLRDQLLDVLDSKLTLDALTSPQREALAPELASAKREIELLRIEADNYRREVEECRKNLSTSLEANERLAKQLDEVDFELRGVKSECRAHSKELEQLRMQALDAEAVEWGHAQHVDLISKLKAQLRQSDERAENEARTRAQLDEQLKVSLQNASDLQVELQEMRGALDAAEMLTVRLQSAESSLALAQETAASAQESVEQIRLETKAMAEEQRLSLRAIEDSAAAARMKECELREELDKAHWLIEKLSNTNEKTSCSYCMSPLGKEEPGSAQGTTTDDTTNAATIEQLELDLELLDLAAHRKVTVEETGHNSEHEILQKSSPDVHYPGEQTVEDQNLDAISKVKVSDVEDVQGERDLQSIQKHQKMGSDDEPEASAIITSLQEELTKLKPQLQLGEQREAVAKNTATELVTELQNVKLVVEAVQQQESKSPANSLSSQKDVEARALQNWEVATTRLLEYLNEGDHALTEAVNEMEGLRSESLLLGDASPSRMHLKLMMTSPSPSRMHLKHMMMTSPSPSRMQLKHMMTSPSPQAVAVGSKGKGSVTNHQGLEKKLNVCSVLLSWLSEKMVTDSSAKVELNCVEEKRSLLSRFENDLQVDPSNALLKEADSKAEVEIYVQTPLLENKGTGSLELGTLFDGVRQSQSETVLAQMRVEISNLKVELMGCETQRERLAMEKNELALKLERTEEMWNKSSMVLSTLVCWSLDCRVADQEVQRLKNAEFDASLQERDNQITGLRSDIDKSAAQVREHMHEFELLLSHNQRWMLDLDEARKEIINKDQALLEMQNEFMKVQEELVQCEDRRLRLDVEKGKLEIQVTESGEALEALREKVTLITEQLQVSEGKVVEMTTTQAAMAIAQENWGLQKEGLESHAKEVEEKSRNLEEELEAARIELYTIQAQLSEAESQKTTLFQEGNRVAAELEDEIQAWKHCAEECDQELEMRGRKLAELEGLLAALQSEMDDARTREITLSQHMDEAQHAKEESVNENCKLKMEVKELSQLGEDLREEAESSKLKIQEAEEKLEEAHRQIEAMQAKIDVLVEVKEKLETENECIKGEFRHSCRNMEEELERAQEDKKQMEDLSAALENRLLEELDRSHSENSTLVARVEELENALEKSRALVMQKEKELAMVRQELNGIEDYANEAQEKLDVSTLLMKELAVSEEECKSRLREISVENEKLRSCLECREMEFSSLVAQKGALEVKLHDANSQESLVSAQLTDLQKNLEALEVQWQAEKRGYCQTLKEAEEQGVSAAKNYATLLERLGELETQWANEREGMSNHITQLSKDYIELKTSAKITQVDLTEARSLLSAADAGIAQLLQKSSALKESNKQLYAEHEALRLELSHWEQYTIELQHQSSSCSNRIPDCNENRSIAHTEPIQNHLDGLKREVERIRRECENLRAQVLDKDRTILSVQTELDASISSSRQVECELLNVRLDRTRLQDQLNNLTRDLKNAQNEISCRDAQVGQFEVELHKMKDVLVHSEAKMEDIISSNRQMECELVNVLQERTKLEDELSNMTRELKTAQDEISCREAQVGHFELELHKMKDVLVHSEAKLEEFVHKWGRQREELEAEREAARLDAIEKGSEVTVLRRQFEAGLATLKEAEVLINALVKASESEKREVLKWKVKEEERVLEGGEMMDIIEDEVSITMDHVERDIQALGLEIHDMRMLLQGGCLRIPADLHHEIEKEFRVQIGEMMIAKEEAQLKVAALNAKLTNAEDVMHKNAVETEALQIALRSAEVSLESSQAALKNALNEIEIQQTGWAATRKELQVATLSVAEKESCITNLSSEHECSLVRIAELDGLYQNKCQELTISAENLRMLEAQKLTLGESAQMQLATMENLRDTIKQLEMLVADEMSAKESKELEVVSLLDQKICLENNIRSLEGKLRESQDELRETSSKLQNQNMIIEALSREAKVNAGEVVLIQGRMADLVTELDDLRQHVGELETTVEVVGILENEKRVLEEAADVYMHTVADLKGQNVWLEAISQEANDTILKLKLEREILTTVMECTGSELREKEVMIAHLNKQLEESYEQNTRVLLSSQTAIAASAYERDQLVETLNSLENDKKKLEEGLAARMFEASTLELQIEQLQAELQEAITASTQQQLELDKLKTMLESAVKEAQEKGDLVDALWNDLESSRAETAKTLVSLEESIIASSQLECERDRLLESLSNLESDKKELKEGMAARMSEVSSLESKILQLQAKLQEEGIASTQQRLELDSLKTMLESASREAKENSDMTNVLRKDLENSQAETAKTRVSLQENIVTSSQLECERDRLSESLNHLENEKKKLEEGMVASMSEVSSLELQIVQLEAKLQEATTASSQQQLELDNLKTMLERASREAKENSDMANVLRKDLEISQAEAAKTLVSLEESILTSSQLECERDRLSESLNHLENEKKKLEVGIVASMSEVSSLELQIVQLEAKLQEATTASSQQQLELDNLKTMLERASREAKENSDMANVLRKDLENSQAEAAKTLVSLEESIVTSSQLECERDRLSESLSNLESDKKELKEGMAARMSEVSSLESKILQLQAKLQEEGIASTQQKLELDSLKTMLESASREAKENSDMTNVLRKDLEISQAEAAKTLVSLEESILTFSQLECERDRLSESLNHLENEKKKMEEGMVASMSEVSSLELQIVQLEAKLQEATTASSQQQLELDNLKTMLERASREAKENSDMANVLRKDLEISQAEAAKTLVSLEESIVTSSQLECERSRLLESLNHLENEKKELEEGMAARMSEVSSLDLQIAQLEAKLQEATTASSQQQLELDNLKTILESALREAKENGDMENVLRKDLEISQAEAAKTLVSLEESIVTSSQLECERDRLLESLNRLENEKKELEEGMAASMSEVSSLELQIVHLEAKLQEATTASSQEQLELDNLKTMLESALREVQEKDDMANVLRDGLVNSQAETAKTVISLQESILTSSQLELERDRLLESLSNLENDKKNVEDGMVARTCEVSSLDLQIVQLHAKLQEAGTSSSQQQLELDNLKNMLESAWREAQGKDDMENDLRNDLVNSQAETAKTLATLQEYIQTTSHLECERERLLETLSNLENEKKELEEGLAARMCEISSLEMQIVQLEANLQESNTASAQQQLELDNLKNMLESTLRDVEEKGGIATVLRNDLEHSQAQAAKTLVSLQENILTSSQLERERDHLLETTHTLEMHKKVLKEELEVQSQHSSNLESQVSKLQIDLQEALFASSKQQLELQSFTSKIQSAAQEAQDKESATTHLENLLQQSRVQNAQMLQSSQEIVDHFSLLQSQLDSSFQQVSELEEEKMHRTAEVESQLQVVSGLRAQIRYCEAALEDLSTSFSQLEEQKGAEVSALQNEVEKLKTLQETELRNWQQRVQEATNEKDITLASMCAELLATKRVFTKEVDSLQGQLQECHRHISEINVDREALMDERRSLTAMVSELQEKLEINETSMEKHFTTHCTQQEVLKSLRNERSELQSTVKDLQDQIDVNQQKARAAETLLSETRLEMEAFEREMKRKDDLLQSLESDISLLQESALQDLQLRQEYETSCAAAESLQQELNLQRDRRTKLEAELAQMTEEAIQARNQSIHWKGIACALETELDKKRQMIESLEDELQIVEQNMSNALEDATGDLKEVENERDRLQTQVLILNEQLEMSQAMVDERDAVASEARMIAELSKTQAEEKEDEAKLLSRSVEELESTVYALETQLGLLKRETECQRLLREDIEMELQRLNNHTFMMQAALDESSARNVDELKEAQCVKKELERKLEEKDSEMLHLQTKLENLEMALKDKDVQLKVLESTRVPTTSGDYKAESGQTTPKSCEIVASKTRGSGSPFKCVGTGLAQQMSFENDADLFSYQRRIDELEALASSRQKEVFMLNSRLAEAESMTHDVLRDLLGVKLDMTSVASMLGQQQIQQLAESAQRMSTEAHEKEEELSSLRSQINDFIDERERLLEEINQRQSEMVAARVAAEKLRQREQALVEEVVMYKAEGVRQQEKIKVLEIMVEKLPAGQQGFQHQINHHIKIKEENWSLRSVNEQLSAELKRRELLFAGLSDELARYRASEQKSPSSHMYEEQCLRKLLQEAENSRVETAQTLSGLCSAIMQIAGLPVAGKEVDPASAMDALQLLENRFQSPGQEHSDTKIKTKNAGEKKRHGEMRTMHSPLRPICTNFTAQLQRVSSPSPAPR